MRFASSRLFLVAVLLSGSLRAAEPAAGTVTLEQALASVENVSLTVLLARETAAQAVELVTQTRANVLPLVDASVQQRRSKSANRGSSPTNRFDAQLVGSYSLFDPDRLSAVRSARVGVEVARANYQAIIQDVLSDVARIYFAHLRNARRLDVLDANIARARVLFDLARNQLNAGVATQIDVTRAEAQVAIAEQARLQQETVLVQSELVVKRLLDIETVRELRLENFQVRRTEATLFAFGEVKTAFERRADHLAQQKALEQAQVNVRTATFERFPALGISGQYGFGSDTFDDRNQARGWSLGVGVSVPVFDGFRAGADRRVALSRQRSQEMRLHTLELQISAELRLALQDAGSRNAQIAVAEKSVRLAQEELRLAQQRYQQGVADNREVVEAQNRLAIAEDGLVEAVFQYNLSRVELARAKGDVRAILAERAP
jgi:outer membrane protein TolC